MIPNKELAQYWDRKLNDRSYFEANWDGARVVLLPPRKLTELQDYLQEKEED